MICMYLKYKLILLEQHVLKCQIAISEIRGTNALVSPVQRRERDDGYDVKFVDITSQYNEKEFIEIIRNM